MSAGVEQSEGGQDFDLNLAPIIDCFTVLITFMLASASFLAIGVFEASVAANSGASSSSAKPPSVRIDVELTMNKELALKVEGKMNLQKKLLPKDGNYDSGALVAELKSIKGKFPDVSGFALTAADDVEYVAVISMMEAFRRQVPTMSVLLGGL